MYYISVLGMTGLCFYCLCMHKLSLNWALQRFIESSVMAKTKLHIWIEDYHFDTLLITVEISWRKCFSFILKTLLHHRVRLFSNLLAVHYFYIVKPWSMSESKPLSQQAPKSNKSPPNKENFDFSFHHLLNVLSLLCSQNPKYNVYNLAFENQPQCSVYLIN